MTLRYRGAVYEISVQTPGGVSRGVVAAQLDGEPQPVSGQGAPEAKRGPRDARDPRDLGPICCCFSLLALGGDGLGRLELAEANGEVETTTFALFCLGFFASRLLRRFFCDIGWPRGDLPSAGTSAAAGPARPLCSFACTIFRGQARRPFMDNATKHAAPIHPHGGSCHNAGKKC